MIWRCDDWSVVAQIDAPYTKYISATFANRMSWSPDGSFLLTGNSYLVRGGRLWRMHACGSPQACACV